MEAHFDHWGQDKTTQKLKENLRKAHCSFSGKTPHSPKVDDLASAQRQAIEQLLNRVTEENIHGETNTDGAVGREVW